MSDTKEEPAAEPAKKPKKKKKLLLLIIGLLGVLGGGGAGIYASGLLGGGHSAHAEEDPNKPKLKVREGVDEDMAYASLGKGKEPDPKLFQATYYPLKEQFTSNLSDSDAFVQVGVGVSTYYDEKVLKAIETHEMAVRSAMLMTLSEQDPYGISTPEGKAKLQKDLTRAANKVLEEKEGFGGIDDVYFTSFVVQ